MDKSLSLSLSLRIYVQGSGLVGPPLPPDAMLPVSSAGWLLGLPAGPPAGWLAGCLSTGWLAVWLPL